MPTDGQYFIQNWVVTFSRTGQSHSVPPTSFQDGLNTHHLLGDVALDSSVDSPAVQCSPAASSLVKHYTTCTHTQQQLHHKSLSCITIAMQSSTTSTFNCRMLYEALGFYSYISPPTTLCEGRRGLLPNSHSINCQEGSKPCTAQEPT